MWKLPHTTETIHKEITTKISSKINKNKKIRPGNKVHRHMTHVSCYRCSELCQGQMVPPTNSYLTKLVFTGQTHFLSPSHS